VVLIEGLAGDQGDGPYPAIETLGDAYSHYRALLGRR
jgi:hypothetical protein